MLEEKNENLIFDIKNTTKDKYKFDYINKELKNLNKLKPYEFWKYIGEPKYVCAPMVDQSELSFRVLCRRYNTNLCYTPMIHSVMFNTCEKYKKEWLSDINSSIDSPTFVQFCGHDPEMLLRAAKEVEGKCEGIDLNLGCPQGIAKRGNYGAFLLDDTELVLKILGYLVNNISHSAITCKIRLFNEREKTYDFVKLIEKTGVKVLTVHGRVKEQKGQNTNQCDWDAIAKVKSLLNIPIISNGGVENFYDVENCFIKTNVDAVMSSECLLEYPALFSNKIYNIDDIALEYLEISKELNNDLAFVRSHMFKFYYKCLQDDPSLNQVLGSCKELKEFIEFAENIKEKRKNVKNSDKLGWYRRYRVDKTSNIDGKLIEKDDKSNTLFNREKGKSLLFDNLISPDEEMMFDMNNMFSTK